MNTYFVLLVAVVVVVSGAAFASRDALKEYFETGDVPTQAEFGDVIDSSLNLVDDGMDASKKVVTPMKEYVTGDTTVKSEPIYQAKVLTQDKSEFSLNSIEPVTFRWTPVVPKPQEPVTYRLKVWQLMQGQSGTQAMRSNQPIVTKDVDNITEATVSGIYTGPCRPPYLCEYVWAVETMTKAPPATDTGTGAAGAADISTGAR